ncbi:hypothetical protein AAFC00_003290 [Neodothiora populina]|uniref:Signal transduction protein n=1 Tax=Neodothiora populina TaxID=2781224 RepID=A0ABR3P9X9_9PEZI
MKFAKELDQDLVPEWRVKYLDYKTGKKKLKAIARALRNVDRTPQTGNRPDTAQAASSTFRNAPFYTFLNRSNTHDSADGPISSGARPTSTLSHRNTYDADDDNHRNALTASRSQPIPAAASGDGERTPLQRGKDGDGRSVSQYGSIIASPPMSSPTWSRGGASSLRLPGPALDPQVSRDSADTVVPRPRRAVSHQSTGSAYQIGDDAPSHQSPLAPRYRSIFQPKRVSSMSGLENGHSPAPESTTKRAFTFMGSRSIAPNDIALNAYREVDFCQADFFSFLDKELDKIEDFYKQKEDEATDRLKVLREQLHIMRDRRVEELLHAGSPRDKSTSRDRQVADGDEVMSGDHSRNNGDDTKRLLQKGLRVKRSNATKTAQSMKKLGTPSGPRPLDAMQDYVRRKKSPEVPYRAAKHKLKIAMAEYYRGLELLKSYALLNRTAFRKITKKFDKTVNARPSGRYMSEKVNKAYFVNSSIVESHIQAVEDLYARYFERGNHKIAVGKLRAKGVRAGDYTGGVFRNGVLLGIGAVFAIQAVVYGGDLTFDPDPVLAIHTSYLLQIYGGYAMMLLLTLLFCLACRVWQRAKVNYAFIFEFDTRHNLDWRQLAEIPCFLFFLLGLMMWLNFSRFTSDAMYIYWPVVLIGLSVLIVFTPFPVLYHKSRFWFIRSNWRLLVAGLYPVEFRDFFLGDMYCSQTYALGNLELFFCLYAQHWNNPPQCNSSHSRLLGFFSTLPGIWRLLQCLRRYWDTRNVFPHLVNGGKYSFTILYYMSLSLYRIDKTNSLRAMFIFFATINAIYCSVWDIVMDWSLMDPYAKHRFLRSTLAFKYTWWYYIAMVIDPIIRFNWIFYAIYGNTTQHSSVVSFMVAFSEVLRRGMWTLFRVENEHCTNVGRFRASRDIPLPYEVSSTSEDSLTSKPSDEANGRPTSKPDEESQANHAPRPSAELEPVASRTSGIDAPGRTGTSTTPRQRRSTMAGDSPVGRAFSRVGTLLHTAHAQDFERRRKPELGTGVGKDIGEIDDDDDDEDDDDDDDDEDEAEERAMASETEEIGEAMEARRQQHHNRNHSHDGRLRAGADVDNATNGSRVSPAAGREEAGDQAGIRDAESGQGEDANGINHRQF